MWCCCHGKYSLPPPSTGPGPAESGQLRLLTQHLRYCCSNSIDACCACWSSATLRPFQPRAPWPRGAAASPAEGALHLDSGQLSARSPVAARCVCVCARVCMCACVRWMVSRLLWHLDSGRSIYETPQRARGCMVCTRCDALIPSKNLSS